MRRVVGVASAAIVLAAIGCTPPQPIALEKQSGPTSFPAMPTFNYRDLSGKAWNDQRFKGKTILIEFWATWCAPCREIAPELHSFSKRNRGKVDLLSISLDRDRKVVERYIQKHPFDNPVIHGGDSMAKPWNVAQIPALVLIRDGHIVFKWEGKEAVLAGLQTIESEKL